MAGTNNREQIITYECCFCSNTINNQDITSLIATINWDKPESKQHSQQLFCHLACLKDVIHKNILLYDD